VATPTVGESTASAQLAPTGSSDDANERWVEPTEMSAIEIVDVDLRTRPANSVNATSVVTVQNSASVEREVEVRFVLDGDLLAERVITAPAETRTNVTHSAIVSSSGEHEFAANVGADTAQETVRTFDFVVGVVEIDAAGEASNVTVADIGSTEDASTAEAAATDGGDSSGDGTNDGTPLAIAVIGLLVLAAVAAVIVAFQRDDEADEPEP
jgi:hypothetical protein